MIRPYSSCVVAYIHGYDSPPLVFKSAPELHEIVLSRRHWKLKLKAPPPLFARKASPIACGGTSER